MSTFYSDGYRDAQAGQESSPPDEGVYGQEYLQGYSDGLELNQVLVMARQATQNCSPIITL